MIYDTQSFKATLQKSLVSLKKFNNPNSLQNSEKKQQFINLIQKKGQKLINLINISDNSTQNLSSEHLKKKLQRQSDYYGFIKYNVAKSSEPFLDAYFEDSSNIFNMNMMAFFKSLLTNFDSNEEYNFALSDYYDLLIEEIANQEPEYKIKGYNSTFNIRKKLLKKNKEMFLEIYKTQLMDTGSSILKIKLREFIIEVINYRIGIEDEDHILDMPSMSPSPISPNSDTQESSIQISSIGGNKTRKTKKVHRHNPRAKTLISKSKQLTKKLK